MTIPSSAWEEWELRSPTSAKKLRAAGRSVLTTDDGERWPVVDGIPFLRTGREALAREALAALDDGDDDTATTLLLMDRDDWASGDGAAASDVRAVVAGRDEVSFREAMRLLAFGPVADYFAHRWSDPTYLSGLALAEAYWRPVARVLELGCGAGHFLRAFAPHAASVTGLDVVFAKLWLARHFLAPTARLLCCDASRPWPVAPGAADLIFCHDAFYFFADKQHVVGEMRRAGTADSRILCGHLHNAECETMSSGAPMSAAQYEALFAPSILYDDRELTSAFAEGRAPRPSAPDTCQRVPAVSVAAGAASAIAPNAVAGLLGQAAYGARLRRNPLYVEQDDGGARVVFPSERYEREYGGTATYPMRIQAPAAAISAPDGATAELVRRRVLLDLPERW